MKNNLTDESIRIERLYDEIDSQDLLGCLTNILCLTNENRWVAYKRASNVIHTQGKGKNRSVKTAEDNSANHETYKDEYINDLYRVTVVEVLKAYVESKKDDPYILKTLIIYLMVKRLYSIVYEIGLPQEYLELSEKIIKEVVAEKETLVTQLYDHLVSVNKHLLAERTLEEQYSVLEMKPSLAVSRYYSDITTESFDDVDYDLMLHLRSRYVVLTTSPKINEYCAIIGFSESTFTKLKRWMSDNILELTSSEDQVKILNSLIFNG